MIDCWWIRTYAETSGHAKPEQVNSSSYHLRDMGRQKGSHVPHLICYFLILQSLQKSQDEIACAILHLSSRSV